MPLFTTPTQKPILRVNKLIDRDDKALCEFYDVNEDLVKDKRGQTEKEFHSFIGHKNESIFDHTSRFLTTSSNPRKYEEKLTNLEHVTNLLDFFPLEWSLQVRMLNQEKGFSDFKLMDIINKIKSFELDLKRREYNQAMFPSQVH